MGAAGVGDTGAHDMALTAIHRKPDQPDLGEVGRKALDQCTGAVAASVVDDDHLDGALARAEVHDCRAQRRFEPSRFVIGRDDDGDGGVRLHDSS